MVNTISANTKISQLLEVDRDLVIKTLTNLNSKFSKLKNPILRSLLVKRVSIARACKVCKTEIADFMWSMQQIGFRVADGDELCAASNVWVEPLDYLDLDLRPLLAQGKDPLKKILSFVKKLEENQGLKLISPFEPVPLIQLLARKGFSYRIEQADPNTVIVYFNKPLLNTKTSARDLANEPR